MAKGLGWKVKTAPKKSLDERPGGPGVWRSRGGAPTGERLAPPTITFVFWNGVIAKWFGAVTYWDEDG